MAPIPQEYAMPDLKKSASLSSCRAFREGEVFIVENDRIRREFLWNGGNLATLRIRDVLRGTAYETAEKDTDCAFPGESGEATDGAFRVRTVAASPIAGEALAVDVEWRLGGLEVRRTFTLRPGVPAVSCSLALRGRAASASWTSPGTAWERKPPDAQAPRLDRLPLPSPRARVTAVELFDVTDNNNNLVRTWGVLPYTVPLMLSGNVLLAADNAGGAGLFVLKDGPCAAVQLSNPGFDFSLTRAGIRIFGTGAEPADLRQDAWIPCYGDTVGVSGSGELDMLLSLKAHLASMRRYVPGRDPMIMLNTWGDGGADKRIGEAFALAELDAGSRLGVSHFQLDAGWQKGKGKSMRWDSDTVRNIGDYPEYWEENEDRFPHGFAPVARRAKEAGIELCLWFNPAGEGGYSHWRGDAEALIGKWKKYGIRTFKIDGVTIRDKRGERNFYKFLDAVAEGTGGEASFNLDVTAGRRFGYHGSTRYGNLFLENRYTDWMSYYPHWTLRNLWQLSRWVQPQFLQVEFLNRWRNADRYDAGDPLAPSRVPFDYCFAVTMMGQPLAWLEASGLPEEAFSIAPLLRAYRACQADIHAGVILPIGSEPDGQSWTGFQSLQEGRGHFLVFRESCDREEEPMAVWGLEGRTVSAKCLLGHGKDFSCRVGKDGGIRFALPAPLRFALYEYRVAD
jgi:alpha-galactosidase